MAGINVWEEGAKAETPEVAMRKRPVAYFILGVDGFDSSRERRVA